LRRLAALMIQSAITAGSKPRTADSSVSRTY